MKIIEKYFKLVHKNEGEINIVKVRVKERVEFELKFRKERL